MTDTEARLAANLRKRADQATAEDAMLKTVRDAMKAKALTVGCTTCGAHSGNRCVTAGSRGRYTSTHTPRFRLANRAQLVK